MFYNKLEYLCKSNGIAVTALLIKLGISTSKGTAWKNGSVPNGELLIKLADYFDVSVDYLLDHDPKDAPAFSPKQRKVLELYDSLSPEQQENFERLLDSVLGLKKQQ